VIKKGFSGKKNAGNASESEAALKWNHAVRKKSLEDRN
jgi:hypothetical protein